MVEGEGMPTEDVSPRFKGLDLWPVPDAVAALVEGQLAAMAAVVACRDALAAAVSAAVERLRHSDGRLVYVGAGASGRLAAQDGVELAPTYGWPDRRLAFVLAGGEGALVRSVEGAEDDVAAAERAVETLAVGSRDVLVGVAASGRTPYTLAVTKAAHARGALVIGIANNPGAPLLEAADVSICLDTGAEVVAGSTRMGAGTAQKAAMNVLSTGIMIGLGRVHDNLMVDLASRSIKLDRRRVEILTRIVPADPEEARQALIQASGDIRIAALWLRGLDQPAAAALMKACEGHLRTALARVESQAPPHQRAPGQSLPA